MKMEQKTYNRWAIIISILALIASVTIPFLNAWFAKAELSVQLGPEFWINQYWGRPTFGQNISIKNTGNKTAYITNLQLLVKRYHDSKFSLDLDGKVFNNTTLLNLKIDKDEILNGSLGFYRVLNDNDRELTQQYSLKIYEQLDSITNNWGPHSKKLEVAEKPFKPIKNFIINNLNVLQPGDYSYEIKIYKDNESSPFYDKKYNFHINQSDLDFMIAGTLKSYIKGMNIFINSNSTWLKDQSNSVWFNLIDTEQN